MRHYLGVIILLCGVAFADEVQEKKHSLQLNPVGLFAEIIRLSGAYTYTIPYSNSAIYIPLFYGKTKGVSQPPSFSLIPIPDENTFTVDVAYRRFINHQTEGMYVQASTRVAKLWGGFEDKSTTKWGLGLGIGSINPLFNTSFYYDIGFTVTRYLTGQNRIFVHGGVDDYGFNDDTALIMELNFSIGYAF